MNKFSITLLAVAIVLSAKTPCELVPMEDAQFILGQSIKQTGSSADECVYTVPRPQGTRATRLSRPPELSAKPWWTDLTGGQGMTAKAAMNEMMKALRDNGALIKDESGSGYSAFSAVDKNSQQISIYILKGTKNIAISLSGPQAATPPPDLMDKIRAVAKRAASRL